MKKPIIIFGSGKIAEVISYFFNNYSDETIAAFTVDKQFQASSHFQGLPLVDFSILSISIHQRNTICL